MNVEQLKELYLNLRDSKQAIAKQVLILNTAINSWQKENPGMEFPLIILPDFTSATSAQNQIAPKLLELLIGPGEAVMLELIPGKPVEA